MLAVDVEFYDESAKLTPLFEFAAPQASDDEFDFDTDKEIDASFEFKDADEEYSDSGKSDDSYGSEEDTDDSDETEF